MSKKQHSKNGAAPSKKNTKWLLPVAVILLTAIVALGLFWIFAAPNRGNAGSPQLQLSAERIDFGKQTFETPVEARFEVKNIGTGTLVLTVPQVATLLEGC
jgi:hypothetical protein